jgi:alkanesulfonate monooxygenase SsuD/methylene tetrahydromethanopterin reductase-like flavin-dependent oxidoreductase (luciferase family)
MHRIGVGFSSSGLTPGEIAACVRLAEELGYESAWMAEGHAGDQFAILAACAAWDRGDREGAARLVPDALIDAVALAGTPAERREKIERYRASGIALPIVTPRGGGPDPKARVVAALRAGAP